jgi:hypothetical protein
MRQAGALCSVFGCCNGWLIHLIIVYAAATGEGQQ